MPEGGGGGRLTPGGDGSLASGAKHAGLLPQTSAPVCKQHHAKDRECSIEACVWNGESLSVHLPSLASMKGTEPFREPPDHAGRDVCCEHGSSPLGGRTAQRPGAGCDINNPGTRADAHDVQRGVRNRSGDPMCGRLVDCGGVSPHSRQNQEQPARSSERTRPISKQSSQLDRLTSCRVLLSLVDDHRSESLPDHRLGTAYHLVDDAGGAHQSLRLTDQFTGQQAHLFEVTCELWSWRKSAKPLHGKLLSIKTRLTDHRKLRIRDELVCRRIVAPFPFPHDAVAQPAGRSVGEFRTED